jgi:hypothetical protein
LHKLGIYGKHPKMTSSEIGVRPRRGEGRKAGRKRERGETQQLVRYGLLESPKTHQLETCYGGG